MVARVGDVRDSGQAAQGGQVTVNGVGRGFEQSEHLRENPRMIQLTAAAPNLALHGAEDGFALLAGDGQDRVILAKQHVEGQLQLGELFPGAVAVHGGVRRDLGPVQGDDADPDHASLLAHEQDLKKQGVDVLKVLAAERGDGPEVGTAVGRQPPEGDVVDDGPDNLAAGGRSGRRRSSGTR